MHSPLLVADYVLASRRAPLTPLQVNKLVYIAHGFTLAMHDAKLVHESVEAWRYGPVFPTLYYALRRFGGDNIPHLAYCNTSLSGTGIGQRLSFLEGILDSQAKIVDMVMDTYGKLSGNSLITITHEEGTPWRKYYRKNRRGIKIPTEEIRTHYQEIINGGP